MVNSAEKAGFNPLTAIRNGGSAGFTRTTTPGNPLAAGLSAAGSFLTNFDPFADAARDQASRLVDAQIRNLDAETGSHQRTLATPSGPVARRPGTGAVSAQPQDLYSPWRDNSVSGGGKIIMLPNAQLPDADQLIVPSLGHVGNDAASVANGIESGAAAARKTVRRYLPSGNPWLPPPASGNQPGGQAYVLPPMVTPWGN
ncbi:hypothetical protein NKG60_08995 [Mesorhizobium sp. M1428]|uniref:hypothetical protein n=1 Tax=Mesorhizobium sp. M1428 TaxID=2957102 RepID=UPI00333A7905